MPSLTAAILSLKSPLPQKILICLAKALAYPYKCFGIYVKLRINAYSMHILNILPYSHFSTLHTTCNSLNYTGKWKFSQFSNSGNNTKVVSLATTGFSQNHAYQNHFFDFLTLSDEHFLGIFSFRWDFEGILGVGKRFFFLKVLGMVGHVCKNNLWLLALCKAK